MKSLALILSVALLSCAPLAAQAQTTASSSSSPEAVAVVVQIALEPGVKADSTFPAMNDMRAMIRRQPGFLSEEFLQNANTSNSPQYVHVIRWASMKYWESVFQSPDFAKLNAAGAKQFKVTASAFKTIK